MDVREFFIATFALLAAGTCRAQAVDEAKPYGRAGVTVVDAGAKTEMPLTAENKPEPGQSVSVHLDANSPCEALVVAFSKKDGRLANGWRPAWLTLPEWEEAVAPPKNMPWLWTQGAEQFDVLVLFLAPGSKDAAEMKKLAAAMQNPNSEARLLGLQTNKLHELIGHAMADKDQSKYRAKAVPSEVAGVMRGDSFPWRQFATAANFSAEQPGVLVFSGSTAK